MLIILDKSVAEGAENLSKKEIEYLDDLLLCHSRMFHYLGASKRIATELMARLGDKITNRSIQTLQLISTQSSDLNAIIKASKFYSIVRLSEVAGMTSEFNDERYVWQCDLQYAAKWFSQPSTLIGEHLIDTKVMKIAAIDASLESGISHSMHKLNFEMSGGCGNAWEVLKNRISNALCPVLCIIDSDRYSPTTTINASSEKCIKVIEEMNGISKFIEIEQREIENLLPQTLLTGAISMLPHSLDRDAITIRHSQMLEIKHNFPIIYRHIDIKEGTCRTWTKKHNVTKFFEPVGIIGKCFCDKYCEGLIAPALFRDILTKAVEFSDSQSPTQLHKSLKNEDRALWLGVGQIVMAFSLANGIRLT